MTATASTKGNSDMTATIFERDIPAFARETIDERVAKVNRRALRRSFPSVIVNYGQTFNQPDPYWRDTCSIMRMTGACPDHHAPMVDYVHATITASEPLRMSGWRLSSVITIDAQDEDGRWVPTIANVPGEPVDRDYDLSDPMRCDHCNTSRYRRDTFVVSHDDGRKMQVGRQCLRDFLGHDPASLLAGLDAFGSLAFSDDEVEGWGRSAPRVYPVSAVVYAAARIVAADGWYVSRAKAEESENSDRPLYSTASRVFDVLDPATEKMRNRVDEEYPANDKSDALHAATMDALAGLANRADMSDWEWKLNDYSRIANVGRRHFGVLASATILGLRAIEREQQAAARKVESVVSGRADAYVAAIGERVTIDAATVEFVREFEGTYGVTVLVKFATPQGDVTWWQSNGSASSWTAGETVRLTGTVKKHETDKYTGRKVSVLTRCKVL